VSHMDHNDALDQALAQFYGAEPPQRFDFAWKGAVRREEQQMMQNKKKNISRVWTRGILPVAAALVLILGAGWAGQQELGDTTIQNSMTTAERSSAKSVSYSATPMAASNETAVWMTGSSADSAAGGIMVEETVNTGMELTAADNRKLIRTVDITLRTESFDADVSGIQQLLSQHGGYMESFFQNGEAGSLYGRSASMSMRVPADQLDDFLSGLDGFGRVTARSESTRDMTVQYTDNEARIQTLRTKLDRLNALLAEAQDVADIIEIEGAIADTQYQLDSYETTQRDIDRRVEMSEVYVTVNETVLQEAADDEDMTLGQRLAAAFKASLQGLGRFGRNLLVFLVMALPVILPVAAIVLVIWLVRRRKAAKTVPENDTNEEDHDEE